MMVLGRITAVAASIVIGTTSAGPKGEIQCDPNEKLRSAVLYSDNNAGQRGVRLRSYHGWGYALNWR